MTAPLATVGILSIGEMGLGIAKLLIAHKFRVVTNVEGRSEDTRTRAHNASVETLPSDASLVAASDYILSIVPPRDALPTAQRVLTALSQTQTSRPHPLYYLDLNAISPKSARHISSLFTNPKLALHIDGGIIGGPPSPKSGAGQPNNITVLPDDPSSEWKRPRIPVSGPYLLSEAPISGARLAQILNINHISPLIGPASGLKCCFATTTKGFTALCIQAFTSAQSMGVLPELLEHMEIMIPAQLKTARGGVVAMPPKAYRWVREMREIGACHAEDGGFDGGLNMFEAIAQVYETVSEETVLGLEKTERRKRGRTVEDVAEAMVEGLEKGKKRKLGGGE